MHCQAVLKQPVKRVGAPCSRAENVLSGWGGEDIPKFVSKDTLEALCRMCPNSLLSYLNLCLREERLLPSAVSLIPFTLSEHQGINVVLVL
jgi:hypothetical protein